MQWRCAANLEHLSAASVQAWCERLQSQIEGLQHQLEEKADLSDLKNLISNLASASEWVSGASGISPAANDDDSVQVTCL